MTERNQVLADRWPVLAACTDALTWLQIQASFGLAPRTIEAYARGLSDYLTVCHREGIDPLTAGRAELARYVRDLVARPNPRGARVIVLDSGVGLANATLQQRLVAVRLFYDYLIEEGRRELNPVGRGRYTPGKAFGGQRERGLIPRFTKLPWIPSDDQWRAILAAAQAGSVRNRLMLALAYDAGLRREELCLLRTDDLDPAHRTLRVRAETTKGRRERIVPYSASTGMLLRAYLDERRTLSVVRGPLFLSASRRNRAAPITLWTWSKVVHALAVQAGVPRFSTHTLRHLCLTDLARAGWELHAICHIRRPSQFGDHTPVHPSLRPRSRREAGAGHGRSTCLALRSDRGTARGGFALMAPAGLAPRPIPTGLAPTSFTAAEWNELTLAMTPGAPGLRSPRVRQALDRLLAPLIEASVALGLCNTIVCAVQRITLHAMWTRGTAWGVWDASTWQAVARTSGHRFCANVLGVAIQLGAISGAEALSAERLEPTKLARRLFGAEAVDREVNRVRLYLRTVGYGPHSDYHSSLLAAISRLLVEGGRAGLEAITLEALERAHAASPARAEPSMAYYRLAHALHGMGLLPRGLRRRTYHKAPLTDVDPVWVEWCERWRCTTTLAPNTAQCTYYGALKAGRWLLREHPSVRTPEDWTRDLALAYLTAVNQGIVGDLVAGNVQRRGLPLAARSKAWLLSTIRRFFIDCQEWGWCATHFDPTRTLATPRSVKALIAPNPRVLADDVWAKLLWAGLHLELDDLPTSPPSFGRPGRGWPTYPLALVKATAVAWLFTGLRSDELARLRVGCIRWQASDSGPGAGVVHTPGDDATCLLDVPTHKTGGSYTKPVDPLVGDVIAAWEMQRKPQPLFVDRKTHESVALLFAWRGRSLAPLYFNKTLIPLLCGKAGVPQQDARGRITSHRARATIATQLYNAKEPMTLFELQAWLGHRSPETTQHYARITPTTLAKAYNDAGYFARNVRTIEVLIDREAVENGAAAAGTPWQYFDLGHGLCTYSFFEQCPHRMACARCDFYVPKDSSKAQLLEARGNLQRMLAEIRLTDGERAAVTDGVTAVDNLLERLTDVPTPAGPTPRELARSSFIPLAALGGRSDNASTEDLLKTNGDNPVDF